MKGFAHKVFPPWNYLCWGIWIIFYVYCGSALFEIIISF